LFGWATVDQPHDPPQFIAYRVLLLRRDNTARMSTSQAHPALMQGAVIGRVVGEQRSSGGRGGGQMIFILAVDHVRFGSRRHVDVARPQAEHEGSSHRVFVEVESNLTHW
jgi:hypothetical protein